MIDADRVRVALEAVVAAMKRSGVWEVARPRDEAFEDMGAFGQRTMAFEQWLRWVFVPRIEELLAAGGPWPKSSSVATIATREGDTNPASAELGPALRAFDALFTDPGEPAPHSAPARKPNAAGWALLSKPGRSAADLEAAVACFRQSIEVDPETHQAVANLANALLELGRVEEAISECERTASGSGFLAAAAHNWLGWYFTDRRPELARARRHLERATELRPRWGVAWVNLARALDAAGDLAGACRAYGEAIALGSSHDDTYARDRRLHLEMQLAARGEPAPPPPPGAEVDSGAYALVRSVAPRLAEGRVFMIRPSERDLEVATVGTVRDDRFTSHALIARSAGVLRALTLVPGRGAALAFRESTIEEAADLVLARLNGDAAAREELSPVDAAIFLRGLLAERLGRRFTWRVAGYEPAAVSVGEVAGAISIGVEARPGGGVRIELCPEDPDRPPERLELASRTDLADRAPYVAEATRRAIDARDRFAARRFGRHQLVEELRGSLHYLGAIWRLEPAQFPNAWPCTKVGHQAGGAPLAEIRDSPAGCELLVGEERWLIASHEALAGALDAITRAFSAQASRLRPGWLVAGDRFRVRAPFGRFATGDEVEFVDSRYSRHDGTLYRFRGPAGEYQAWDSDPESAFLLDLDRHLERLGSPAEGARLVEVRGPGCTIEYREGEKFLRVDWDPRNDDVILYLPSWWTTPAGRPFSSAERDRIVAALWDIAPSSVQAIVEGAITHRFEEQGRERLRARGLKLPES